MLYGSKEPRQKPPQRRRALAGCFRVFKCGLWLRGPGSVKGYGLQEGCGGHVGGSEARG